MTYTHGGIHSSALSFIPSVLLFSVFFNLSLFPFFSFSFCQCLFTFLLLIYLFLSLFLPSFFLSFFTFFLSFSIDLSRLFLTSCLLSLYILLGTFACQNRNRNRVRRGRGEGIASEDMT